MLGVGWGSPPQYRGWVTIESVVKSSGDCGGKWGRSHHLNQPYRAGHGLAGQRVDIRADGVYYAGVLFGTLERLKV